MPVVLEAKILLCSSISESTTKTWAGKQGPSYKPLSLTRLELNHGSRSLRLLDGF